LGTQEIRQRQSQCLWIVHFCFLWFSLTILYGEYAKINGSCHLFFLSNENHVYDPRNKHMVWFMVFDATFNNISGSYIVAVSFIGGGNWSTMRKPL
jgi:hypothetical protein